MRKINIYIIILLLPLILAFVYITRINFAHNISITFKNITKEEFGTINFYGTSPLNRILYFNKAENIKNFSTLGNKAFINKIYLYLPDSIMHKILEIELSIGIDNYRISSENFNTYFIKSEKLNNVYILNENCSKTSFLDIFTAVFSWERKIRIIIFLFLIILVMTLPLYYLLSGSVFMSLRAVIKRNILYIISNIKRIFLKSFVFKIFLFFNIFLLIILFLVIHYNIYCNFSGYVFLLFLYTLFYLSTFIFKRNISGNTLANIRLALSSFFIVLIATEFMLRFFDINASYLERNTLCYERVFNKYNKSRYYTREPIMDVNYTTTEFAYYRKVYPEGFTQAMIKKEKQLNEFRILALGDSFTEGVGVCSDSAWINLLNKKLSAYYPDIYINTFNAGVVSSDPVFQYVLLTEKFNTLDFDMVIVATNESDMTDIVVRGGFERFQDDGSVLYKNLPSWEWLYGLSYVFRLIVINGLDYNHILLKNDVYNRRRTEALKTIYEAEEKFYKYSKENNIKLITVFHPSLSEVCFPHFYKFPYIIHELNKKYPDFHIIDLHNHYVNNLKMNLQNISKYYWKIDGHHNGNGYNAFAECVFNYIKDNGLIK